MEIDILIEQMKLFLSSVAIDKEKNYTRIKFSTLNSSLAEDLRNDPDNFFKALRCLGLENNTTVMFSDLPEDYKTRIEDISKNLLGKFIQVEGKIEKKTAIITKIKNCKYECPSCGLVLDILMDEEKNKTPTRCGCGRRGHFKVLHRTYEDCFELVLSEGEYNLRIIFGEPFLNPEFKTFLRKGKKIIVSGYVVGEPKKLPHGSESREIEKTFIANNVEEMPE